MKKTAVLAAALAVILVIFSASICPAQDTPEKQKQLAKLLNCNAVHNRTQFGIAIAVTYIRMMDQRYPDLKGQEQIKKFKLDVVRSELRLKLQRQILTLTLFKDNISPKEVDEIWYPALENLEFTALILIRALEFDDPKVGAKEERKNLKVLMKSLQEQYNKL